MTIRRAYRQKGNKGGYVNLTEHQKRFIEDNKYRYTHAELADILNVSKWAIEYYRRHILKTSYEPIIVEKDNASKRNQLKGELNALLFNCHKFPSFYNGAYQRIKDIINILDNKYI